MKWCLVPLFLLVAAGASAQSLVPPGEIVIYVNSDVRNPEFVEPLVCELKKVVQAPVRAAKIDIAMTDDLLEAGRQYSPRKIVNRFGPLTQSDSALPNPFRYLLVDHDLKVPELRYVFAETYRPPMSVISVTRFTAAVDAKAGKQSADIVMVRVYKLMVKSVAIMAGLRSDGCVMAFPRSLPELDAKSSEYCADDRAALVAARVIKETPSTSCNDVVAAR